LAGKGRQVIRPRVNVGRQAVRAKSGLGKKAGQERQAGKDRQSNAVQGTQAGRQSRAKGGCRKGKPGNVR
jgi:hypothetical protein